MGSTSARRKLAEELNAKEDRISNLPRCLISHILSFLPTKNALATSVLSTKWKDLWTLTPSLELVDYHSRLQIPQADRSLLQTSFTKFMYQVLLNDRFPCLRKFHLRCCRDYGEYHVYAWVDFAVKHNVQELVLKTLFISSPMLPRSLFTCRTLVKLTLHTNSVMMAHTEVVLPCLKVLDLICFTFPDDQSITSFFSGCPVLEEVILDRCIGKGVRVVNISAPLLRTLVVYVLPAEYTPIPNYKIVFNTPCLLELSVTLNTIGQGYELNVLPHLKRASIHFVDPEAPDMYFENLCRALSDLLKVISRVEFLELEGDESMEEAISVCNYPLATFLNMKSLECHFVGSSLLLELLHSSPLLRSLTLGEGPRWNPPGDVPKCLLFHLKFIEILCFLGEQEEIEAVEYFLKNAHVLEKLVVRIGSSESTTKKLEISTKLLMLQRASIACQIELI